MGVRAIGLSTRVKALETGKISPDILEKLLSDLGASDPRVLVGPGLGEDCAVIDMGDRLLIAKSDPVTFATDCVGWYVVQVNANDVACTGADPLWFLPTILLPTSATPDDLRSIFMDISVACRHSCRHDAG